ncbi:MAG: ATP-dependent protease ATPase subunit HslU [Clostridia bacterium]|nr:ATP-dependent protease ATPase subunit HslU [Clostridia bacterium]
MMEFTPKQIIEELDNFIIGQADAKRSVAVALRNRYRRSLVAPEMREEITPKNIIMKGPTGVGKTEIARRLAKLVRAPFVKVEATKFTEVGYVGRDVESMIRDLVEAAIRIVKEEKFEEIKPKATEEAVKRLNKAILPLRKKITPDIPDAQLLDEIDRDLRDGKLDDLKVTIQVSEQSKPIQMTQNGGNAEINLGSIFQQLGSKPKKNKEVYVRDAMKMIVNEVSESLVDMDSVNVEALRRAEQDGIIFIDEIDKIAGGKNTHGPDVSREGVQRDILPIVEGSLVTTKYGPIRTDFILFIAAGAFHISEVKDLIPELQGRFPIIVTLESLTRKDFIKILTEPNNAITKLYAELLKTDGVKLSFTADAIAKVAEIAEYENTNNENLGARRLHAIIEMLLEEVSFEACGEAIELEIDSNYVESHLSKSFKKMNLKKYIL